MGTTAATLDGSRPADPCREPSTLVASWVSAGQSGECVPDGKSDVAMAVHTAMCLLTAMATPAVARNAAMAGSGRGPLEGPGQPEHLASGPPVLRLDSFAS